MIAPRASKGCFTLMRHAFRPRAARFSVHKGRHSALTRSRAQRPLHACSVKQTSGMSAEKTRVVREFRPLCGLEFKRMWDAETVLCSEHLEAALLCPMERRPGSSF